ncbi:MAG: flagellar type III secretion system protein FlhB [Amaricoccus sp.]
MSEGEGGGGEKVFDPTPQRLAEARKKGDIPRSADVTAAATYLALLAAIATLGVPAVQHAGSVLMIFLSQPDRLTGLILGPGGARLAGGILGELLLALAPLFLVPMAAVLVSLFAQQAVVFSGEKLAPKMSRVSILSNAKNKFGVSGLVEFGKAFAKLAAIGTALFLYLSHALDRMLGTTGVEARIFGGLLGDTLSSLLTITTLIAVAIGALDFVWQRFDHARKLRMSLQDLKDEHRQSEGDPHFKAQRRQRGQEIANNRMLLDVPKADVVIVNPTHYAVALKWSRAKGSAPVCVAKGEDALALKIREIAETAQIPIHSDPPTARALHATVEIGHEIRPEHYRAVAAAVRFADRMRRAARMRGF